MAMYHVVSLYHATYTFPTALKNAQRVFMHSHRYRFVMPMFSLSFDHCRRANSIAYSSIALFDNSKRCSMSITNTNVAVRSGICFFSCCNRILNAQFPLNKKSFCGGFLQEAEREIQDFPRRLKDTKMCGFGQLWLGKTANNQRPCRNCVCIYYT